MWRRPPHARGGGGQMFVPILRALVGLNRFRAQGAKLRSGTPGALPHPTPRAARAARPWVPGHLPPSRRRARASAAQPRDRPLGCGGLPRSQAPGGETTRFSLRAPGGMSANAGPTRGPGRLPGRRAPRPPVARLGRVPSSRERFLPRSRIQAAGPAVKTGGVSFILAHKVPKGNRGP